MSTQPMPDPYAAYGGKSVAPVTADPYAAYGGKVADGALVGPPSKSPGQAAKDNPFPSDSDYAKTPTIQPSFSGSFLDSSGLSSIGHFVSNISDATSDESIKGAVRGIVEGLKSNGIHLAQSTIDGLHGDFASAFGNGAMAIPIVGNAIEKAANQVIDNPNTTSGNYLHDLGQTVTTPEAMGTLVGTAASPVLMEGAGKLVGAAAKGARSLPVSLARTAVGDAVDRTIIGDTVTPRQQYGIAKNQGVNLDLAQATGGAASKIVKRTTEHSLSGNPIYDAHQAENAQALNQHVQNILQQAAPQSMAREDFGNAMKETLSNHQEALNQQAGQIYKQLDADVGDVKPDTSSVRNVAQRIIDSNTDYYKLHPEMLKGGAGQAWQIVQNLAQDTSKVAPKVVDTGLVDSGGKAITRTSSATPTTDTWSDLHKLRSDLMNQYRSPDLVGSRAEGWLKQLTGSVDNSMTGAGSQLTGAQQGQFRVANDIYKQMKETYDNPTSKLYHVVRAPDGLTAANMLSDIKPDVARFIGENAPEMMPQLQRQTMSRILSPAGNEIPEYGTLPGRFGRAQKESLRGVLTDTQLQQLENVSRTSRIIRADANPSGSGKVGRAAAEGAALAYGVGKFAVSAATGNLAGMAEGALPIAAEGASRVASKAITNPALVDKVMTSSQRWTQLGQAKLLQHAQINPTVPLTPQIVTAAATTKQGARLLQFASSLKPGSKAMAAVAAQLAAQSQEEQK